jgi:beta-lactamase regulating signal transducer with metallopeptidase domain
MMRLHTTMTMMNAAALAGLLAKGALLLLATALAARLAARASAALRHVIWGVGLFGCLGLAASALLLPAWPVTGVVLPAALSPGRVLARASMIGGAPVVTGSPGVAILRAVPWARLAVALWAAGTALLLARLAFDLWRARRLVRAARPLRDDLVAELSAAAGVRAPALRESDQVAGPFTTGLLRSTIVMPRAARDWTEAERRAVLAHELAHVVRRDCLTQLLAHLARALHWPNPLAWWADRRLRAEREMAADDAALRAGSRPSDYARFLVGLAGTLGQGPAPSTVLAMATRSPLGERLGRLLDPARRRAPLRARRAACALLAALAVAIPLGCLGGGAGEGDGPARSSSAAVRTTAPKGVWVVVADEPGPGQTIVVAAGQTARARQLGLTVNVEGSKASPVVYLAGPAEALRQFVREGAIQIPAPEWLLIEDLKEGRARTVVANLAALVEIPRAELAVDRSEPAWPTLWLAFPPDTADRLMALSGAHIGSHLAVMVDDHLLSKPIIRSAFGRQVQLTVASGEDGERAIGEVAAALGQALPDHRR